jgi:hypothetical protein
MKLLRPYKISKGKKPYFETMTTLTQLIFDTFLLIFVTVL